MIFARKPQKRTISWQYPDDYFPRIVYYKSDANRLSKMAKAKGGFGVVVKPFVTSEFELEKRLVNANK